MLCVYNVFTSVITLYLRHEPHLVKGFFEKDLTGKKEPADSVAPAHVLAVGYQIVAGECSGGFAVQKCKV
jgi:hypothetical protein